ncbi:MAG: cupin domain-containing protein [Bryobacteraceae bacterium]
MLTKVNLADKFSLFTEHFSPKIAGALNGQEVKLVKFQGEFVWHHHDDEDELFLVVRGRMTMQLRDGDIELNQGEFLIVPHGVEHCPKAQQEVEILLFEPADTRNTGNVENALTAAPVAI